MQRKPERSGAVKGGLTTRGEPWRRRLFLIVLLLVVLASALFVRSRRSGDNARSSASLSPAELRRLAGELASLEARERRVAETVWAKELLAQQCGLTFVRLWDAINASSNKLAAAAGLNFERLILPDLAAPETLPHGLRIFRPESVPERAARKTEAEWRAFLETVRGEGWRLRQCEFRQNRFDADETLRPQSSVFRFAAHLENPKENERIALAGDLGVRWSEERNDDGSPRPTMIDASGLTLTRRRGAPPFHRVLHETVSPPEKSYFIDPILLHDLDGDGLSEIVLAARNLVFHRRSWERFEPRPFCRHPPGLIFTGVIADFDTDGWDDFLCVRFEGLFLVSGSAEGTRDHPGRSVWRAPERIRYGQVLTCGDIDGDGDLDVWLGQYKGPYDRGQMPTPYYDANDGYPAYLLLNEGEGSFRDVTEERGLGAKRRRRTYSASLVDLDRDHDLDLLVTSDFAGVDLYRNDGKGRFRDVTREWVEDSKAFGMSHTFGDFDRDGLLDFLVTGMHCPTAQRLAGLGLARPDRPEYAAMHARMAGGNRLFLGQAGDGFGTGPPGASISRSGWSWGATSADFDNDGFVDVYVPNGHESMGSARDYEPHFWLHDIYVANSEDDPLVAAYFGSKFTRTRGHGWSYGGYEKSRLFLNREGKTFLEAGYPMGVALEQDSRNAIADDLDGDGRMDLVLTTFEVWPEIRQTVQVYRNQIAETGDWIGVRLRQRPGGPSPIGTVARLRFGAGETVDGIVTGDSHRSQHAPSFHFGLGASDRTETLEVRWPDGSVERLDRPELNRYHELGP